MQGPLTHMGAESFIMMPKLFSVSLEYYSYQQDANTDHYQINKYSYLLEKETLFRLTSQPVVSVVSS